MENLCIFILMMINRKLPLVILVGIYLVSCQPKPYATTNRHYRKQAKEYARIISQAPLKDSISTVQWVGTTNFNLRKPNMVIIHHTAQNSCEQTLKTFTTSRTGVSAHYVICRNGTIHHMLNDYLRAWHGGTGKWGQSTDINSASIGIELDNNGFEPFAEEQISQLIVLLGALKKAYSIPAANFIGHSDMAPTRKVDPNVHFPWERLAGEGFGIWWDDTTNVQVPADFNHLQALRIIGYDTRDSIAAIKAFKRKYVQQENNGNMTEADRKILFTLYRKLE